MNNFFIGKKVLVTGGAGFIGAHLVKKLVALGARVSVIDNLSRGQKSRLRLVLDKIHFFKVDLKNEKKAQPCFVDQEMVFNLAALNTGVDYDLGRTEIMFEENLLLQMLPLKMASRSPSVTTFIQISSASIYSKAAMENQIPTPESADEGEPEPSKLGYALAKKMGEKLAVWYFHDTGLKTVRVRLVNVFGEGDNSDQLGHFIPVMIRKFMEASDRVEVFGSGQQQRSFVYVGDVVAALLLLAEKGQGGEVYNVDSNQEKTVKEVVTTINQAFAAKNLRIDYDLTKPEGSKRRMLDSSKIRRLGWCPQTEFEVGLKRMIDSIKSSKIGMMTTDDP